MVWKVITVQILKGIFATLFRNKFPLIEEGHDLALVAKLLWASKSNKAFGKFPVIIRTGSSTPEQPGACLEEYRGTTIGLLPDIGEIHPSGITFEWRDLDLDSVCVRS